MKPDVDWVKFLYLMEGQCEPEFSEYEVTETLVRRADIDPDLWHDVEITGTLRVNTADREREVSWTDTEADIARTISGWRVTQQESELHFPCFPSEVKRWAESQFLDVGQELEDACNDEARERLAEQGRPDVASTGEDRAIITSKGRGPGRPAELSHYVPLVNEELSKQLNTGITTPRKSVAIRAVVDRQIPMPDMDADAEVRLAAKDERTDLARRIHDKMKPSRQARNKT